MPRSPRKETELDHVRLEILRAAARAASQTGIDAVTLRDIGREAGYTVGTLYKYFDSKEAIEAGLLEQLEQLILRTLNAAVPAGLNFRQKVELLVHRQLTAAEDWRQGVFAILMVLPGMASTFRKDVVSGIMTAFGAWVETNASRDELRGMESVEVSLFYFGVLEVVMTAAMQRNFEGPLVDLVPKVMRLFFHGVGDSSSPVAG